MEAKVVQLDNLTWRYEDGSCSMRIPPQLEENWGQTEKFDPFPCYTHNENLTKNLLDECVEAAPLNVPVTVAISHYESTTRTNGCATYDCAWKKETPPKWEGYILLNGKRTEIHPAITRYIIPHEYGHLVQYRLQELKDGKVEPDRSKLMEEYCLVRNLSEENKDGGYSGRNHHTIWSEIFANDFRTFVVGRELEFWPHPVKQIGQKGTIKAQNWWNKTIKLLKENT